MITYNNPQAALDHIPFIQSAGGNDTQFAEVHHIPRPALQGKWAECFSLVTSKLLECVAVAAQAPRIPGLEEDVLDLMVERASKLFFLLATLILRKPLSTTPVKNFAITKALSERMDLLHNNNILQLVEMYESDIVSKKEASLTPKAPTTDEDMDRKAVNEALNLLRAGKIGKAQNILLSKGCAEG